MVGLVSRRGQMGDPESGEKSYTRLKGCPVTRSR